MVAPIKPIGPIKPVIAPTGQSTTPAATKPPVSGQSTTSQSAQPKPGEKVFNIVTDKDPDGEFTKVFAKDEQQAQQVFKQQGSAGGQFKGAQLAQESISTMVDMLARNGIEEGRDYYVNGTIYTDDQVMAEDISDIINMQDWDKKRAVSRKHSNSDEYYIDLEGPNAKLAGKAKNAKFKKSLNICRQVLSSKTATSEQKMQAKRYMDSIKKDLGTIVADIDPVSESANIMTDKVHFNIDSERAYQHVMDKFGQSIDWSGDTMVADRKMWPAIEELAMAAGGSAQEEHGPDVDEAAPGLVRHAAGAALGALSGIGGAVAGHMVAGPVGAVAAGAYGGAKGYKLGAAGADELWDKFAGNKKKEDDEVEEGNEFSGALQAARATGQKEFEVDGKKYNVKEASNDYFKRRKDEEDRIAGTKAPARRTPQQTDYAKRRAQEKKSNEGVVEVDEAKHGISKRVRIVSGPADAIGKIGTVGEVRTGLYKGAEKTYTVDYDYDGNTGRSKSIQLKAKDLRLVKNDITEYTMNKKSIMAEGERVKTKTGMIHKGSYGSEVDVNADGSKKKKVAPKSATGQRGRPAKAAEPKTTKSNDLFGRVPDKAPKGKKGTVVKGKSTKDDNLEEARETLKTAKGTIYKGGTYGTSYDVGDNVKKAPANKNPTGQRGRPKKDDSTSKSSEKAGKELQAFIVGSVPKKSSALDKLPKTKHKIKDNNVEEGLAHIRDLKKQITETIRQVQRLPMDKQNDPRVIDIVTRLEETVSKAVSNVLRESHETMAHIVRRFPAEVKQFAAGGELDDGDLYDALYDYYSMHGEMPYGIAKARTGDPIEWVSDRFSRDLGDHYPTESTVDEASGAHMFMTGEVVYHDNQRGKVDRQEGSKVYVHTGSGQMDVWPSDQTSLTRQGLIPTMKKNLGQIGTGIKGFVTGKQEEAVQEADSDITVFEKKYTREQLDKMSDEQLADLASTEYSAEDMLEYDDRGALSNRGQIVDTIMSYNTTDESAPAPMADLALESLATMIRLAGLPKR